jgi:hypothetical protein
MGLPVGIKLIPRQRFSNLRLPPLIDLGRRGFGLAQHPIDPTQRGISIQKFTQTHFYIPLGNSCIFYPKKVYFDADMKSCLYHNGQKSIKKWLRQI